MVIQIDGVNTLNKGAELMLIAILEELEQRCPNSTIWLNPNGILDVNLLPKYNLNFKYRSFLKYGTFPRKILDKFGLPRSVFGQFHAIKGIDLVIDASGFQYSDQWKHSDKSLRIREKYYQNLKKFGSKLVFLPQAFGPFETKNGKESVRIISDYCDLIFAREQQSYEYLIDESSEKAKIRKSCDFTLKVKGTIPKEYAHLKNKVCIIPNKKMITHTSSGSSNYLNLLIQIISFFENKGEQVFLLNHEGNQDEALCHQINESRNNKLEVVTNLAAKNVKGVIGNSKIVISSRFHGVASALSQGVPCMATSWNHKYEMLFNDFDQKNMVLKDNLDWDFNREILEVLFEQYSEIQDKLKIKKTDLVNQINLMWLEILGK